MYLFKNRNICYDKLKGVPSGKLILMLVLEGWAAFVDLLTNLELQGVSISHIYYCTVLHFDFGCIIVV